MKRFFKSVFGRLTAVALAILLQIAVLLVVVSIASAVYYQFSIAMTVLTLLAIVHIVNRDMNIDSKVPWIIVVCVLPLFGCIIYIMFSKNYIPGWQRRLLKKIRFESIEAISNQSNRQSYYRDILDNCYGQSRYLFTSSGSVQHDATDTMYFSCGEKFFDKLTEDLKQAQKYIFLEYFIIEKGQMWNSILQILRQKVKEGVEVRVIYDDIGCISKLPSNYFKHLSKEGIKCVRFNPFRPILSAVHNNRDHRKITVIDGTIGYVGGINLADEYINKKSPYGYWKDSAVRLEGSAVTNLVVLFLQNYDVMAKQTEEFEDYIATSFPAFPDSGVVVPFGDGPRPLYNEQIAENAYLNIINSAEKYVWITTPYLIIDSQLKNALQSAAMRGVDVRIYTPGIPDKKLIFTVTRSHYKQLLRDGVKIFQYTPGFLHAKSIIADDYVGIVGTINLDYRSLIHHYECGVWMYRTRALEQLKADIEKIEEVSQPQDHTTAKLNILQRLVSVFIAVFTPLM